MLTKKQTEMWRKWIKALESGKYRQAQGLLRKTDESRGDAFCCLGVACDIVKKDVKGKWNGDTFEFDQGRSVSGVISHQQLRELFGFTDAAGIDVYLKDGTKKDLATINDEKRSRKGPFSNVLPHIRKYFEKNQFQAKKGKKL